MQILESKVKALVIPGSAFFLGLKKCEFDIKN